VSVEEWRPSVLFRAAFSGGRSDILGVGGVVRCRSLRGTLWCDGREEDVICFVDLSTRD